MTNYLTNRQHAIASMPIDVGTGCYGYPFCLRALKATVQRITRLFIAKIATNNFEMRQINRIFVANHATNESLYISARRLAKL